MLKASLLFVLVFTGLSLVRRTSKNKPTKVALFLEMLATSTLSYLAALILWLGYTSFGFALTGGTSWLLWLLMFVCGVIGVRTLGNRLTHLDQQAKTTTISDFAKELAYHASVFWKLIALIAGITYLTIGSLPNSFVLLSLSFTLAVAIIMESAVNMFQLQH